MNCASLNSVVPSLRAFFALEESELGSSMTRYDRFLLTSSKLIPPFASTNACSSDRCLDIFPVKQNLLILLSLFVLKQFEQLKRPLNGILILFRNLNILKGWHEFKREGDTRILENVPAELRVHLLRGLIDGDGCISRRKGRSKESQWILGFVDLHRSVAEWVRQELIHLGASGCPKVGQHKNNKSWNFMFANRSVPLVLQTLYRDASISLTRKRKLALSASASVDPQK